MMRKFKGVFFLSFLFIFGLSLVLPTSADIALPPTPKEPSKIALDCVVLNGTRQFDKYLFVAEFEDKDGKNYYGRIQDNLCYQIAKTKNFTKDLDSDFDWDNLGETANISDLFIYYNLLPEIFNNLKTEEFDNKFKKLYLDSASLFQETDHYPASKANFSIDRIYIKNARHFFPTGRGSSSFGLGDYFELNSDWLVKENSDWLSSQIIYNIDSVVENVYDNNLVSYLILDDDGTLLYNEEPFNSFLDNQSYLNKNIVGLAHDRPSRLNLDYDFTALVELKDKTQENLTENDYFELLKNYAPSFIDDNSDSSYYPQRKIILSIALGIVTNPIILFILTILVESLIFFLLGSRHFKNYVALFFANVLSYSILFLGSYIIYAYLSSELEPMLFWTIAELSVIIIEFLFLWLFLHKHYKRKEIAIFVIVANLVTASIGLLLYFIIETLL